MSNSIVTFSGLRCTKVRRTAVPSQETATSTSAEATATNKATVSSSARETQVSTASDPVPQPGASSATGAAETEVTSKVSLLPSSTDTSTAPDGISSKDPTSSNNTGQTTLRIALITSLSALVLLILAALVWKLSQRRRKRTTDATDYYATEKPQLDRRISAPYLSPGGSSFQEGKSGSNIHIRDSLAQLEPLPRAVANSPAERFRGRSDSNGLNSSARAGTRNSADFRDPFSDAARIQDSAGKDDAVVMKDPFADPSPPSERENRLLQVGRSLSRSNSRLQRTASRLSTSRGRKDGSNKYESHNREDSTSSSIIVLPGRNSLSPSERTLSYQPTASGLGQWRPDPEKQSTRSSRISTRSDPFDLEEPSMTRYDIVRPVGADSRFDQTFNSATDSTIYSPRNNKGK